MATKERIATRAAKIFGWTFLGLGAAATTYNLYELDQAHNTVFTARAQFDKRPGHKHSAELISAQQDEISDFYTAAALGTAAVSGLGVLVTIAMYKRSKLPITVLVEQFAPTEKLATVHQLPGTTPRPPQDIA